MFAERLKKVSKRDNLKTWSLVTGQLGQWC